MCATLSELLGVIGFVVVSAASRVCLCVTDVVVTQVLAHLARGQAGGYFATLEEGLAFLRGHVGNFPGKHEELKAFANYVRYTAHMVHGALFVASLVSAHTLQHMPLLGLSVQPSRAEPLEPTTHLHAVLTESQLPTLLCASSYT